jgi:membrane-associated phospholipid phosphatase
MQRILGRLFSLKPFDLIAIGYLSVTAIFILIFHNGLSLWWLYVIVHLAIISVILFVVPGEIPARKKSVRFLRYWYPLGLFIFLYEESGILNHLVFDRYFSDIFVQIDAWIFGFQPSVTLSQKLSHPAISEYMSFSYFTYYPLIPFLGTILYLKGKYRQFDTVMFSASLTFYACFLFFIFFPVAGPQFTFEEVIGRELKGYLFAPLMNLVLEMGEIENGAFPSSHVAIAMVILLFSFQYERKVAYILTYFFIMLCVSTVYINAHYFIDIPGGIAVGILGFLLSPRIERRLHQWMELKRTEIYPSRVRSGEHK